MHWPPWRRAASLAAWALVWLLSAYIVADKLGLLDGLLPAPARTPPRCRTPTPAEAAAAAAAAPNGASAAAVAAVRVRAAAAAAAGTEPAGAVDLLVPPLVRRLVEEGANDSATHPEPRVEGHGHQQDALLFLFIALLLGTLVTHLTTIDLFSGLQHTVVLFVLGVCFALVQEGLSAHERLGAFGRSYQMWMGVDPHLILFTMLPALLAGDAMTLDTSVARRVAKQCVYLASVGLVINAVLTALLLKLYLPYDWSLLLSLTTGAILGATDPVAVVALLKELGAPPTLTVQIQGESMLNDGTAIVLYSISYNMLKGETYDVSDILMFLVKKAFCALVLGAACGWIFLQWISAASNKLEHRSSVIQTSLTLCCAYWSFFIAEGVFHISGVLSVVASAIVLAHKMWPVVVSKEAMHTIWHMFEYIGNTLIFFLAGALTGRAMFRIEAQDYLHLVVIYVALIAVRAGMLFASLPVLRGLSDDMQEVSLSHVVVMTWGGLRGAVGLALAIQVAGDRAGGMISEKDADRVLFYVGGVAMLTLVVNATTCPLIVKMLGITSMKDSRRRMLMLMHRRLLEMSAESTSHPAVQRSIAHMLQEISQRIIRPRKRTRTSLEAARKAVAQTMLPVRKFIRMSSDHTRGSVSHAVGSRVNEESEVGHSNAVSKVQSMDSRSGKMDPSDERLQSIDADGGFRVLPSPASPRETVGGKGSCDTVGAADSAAAGHGGASLHLPGVGARCETSDGQTFDEVLTGGSASIDGGPAGRRPQKSSRWGHVMHARSCSSNGSGSTHYRQSVGSVWSQTQKVRRVASEMNLKISRILGRRGVLMQSSSQIVDEFDRAKKKFCMTAPAHIALLDDLPPIPPLSLQEQESSLHQVVTAGGPDEAMLHTINEAFLALTRSEYVSLVEHGMLTPGSYEADVLFGSIATAQGGETIDLLDYLHIFHHIKRIGPHRHSHLSMLSTSEVIPPFTERPAFNVMIITAIVANTLFVFLEEDFRDKANDNHLAWLIGDSVFNGIFLFEFVAKVWVERLRYFYVPWNCLDFFLVLLGIAGFVVNLLSSDEGYSRLARLARIFRVLRIFRAVRLMHIANKIKKNLMERFGDIDVASIEHLMRISILTCFIRGHLSAQHELVRCFGSKGIVDTVEVARCILQSQVAVFKAVSLAAGVEQCMELDLVTKVNQVREGKRLAEELETIVMDAHNGGFLGARETDQLLRPLRDHLRLCQRQMERASFSSDQRDCQPDDGRLADSPNEVWNSQELPPGMEHRAPSAPESPAHHPAQPEPPLALPGELLLTTAETAELW